MAGNNVRKNFPGMIRPCTKCGEPITVTDQMCRQSKYKCSPCQVAEAKDYVERNREKKRAWVAAYSAKMTSERRAKASAAYRERYPDRYAAHAAVAAAVRVGDLRRMPCEVCGGVKSHAHHDDYSKRLEVRWLCHRHHMEHHKMQNMLAARGGK